MSSELHQVMYTTFSMLSWEEWLPRRRWFVRRPGASDPHLDSIVLLGSGLVACFVDVGEDRYFVPLTCELAPEHDGMLDGDGRNWFDGLEDESGIRGLVGDCLDRPEGRHGLRVETRVFDRAALDASREGVVRRGTAEQTNSWAICGDSFVKVFRRIEFGRNLDVEVLEALAGRRELSIPRLRGIIEAHGRDGVATLVAIQEVVAHERNAWEKACAEVASAAKGEDVDVRPWETLGVRVAELHAALLETFGLESLREERRADFGDAAVELARGVIEELRSSSRDGWSPDVERAVESLFASQERLVSLFAGTAPAGLVLQRVHGDLHLGQILSSGDAWTIIDFEGEPARSPQERAAKAPVAKDVAGMLRSFDYACRAGLPAGTSLDGVVRAKAWRDAARSAFLAGYFGVPAVRPLWPADPASRSWLLAFHETEKAFYELRYELRHRPDWMSIPLDGLLAAR